MQKKFSLAAAAVGAAMIIPATAFAQSASSDANEIQNLWTIKQGGMHVTVASSNKVWIYTLSKDGEPGLVRLDFSCNGQHLEGLGMQAPVDLRRKVLYAHLGDEAPLNFTGDKDTSLTPTDETGLTPIAAHFEDIVCVPAPQIEAALIKVFAKSLRVPGTGAVREAATPKNVASSPVAQNLSRTLPVTQNFNRTMTALTKRIGSGANSFAKGLKNAVGRLFGGPHQVAEKPPHSRTAHTARAHTHLAGG